MLRVVGKYAALLTASLVAALVLLALFEIALRVVGVGEGPPAYDPFAGFSARIPIFEPAVREDGTSIFRVSRARLLDFASDGEGPEREFLAAKPPGGFRVFVVGGSTPAGFPYPPRHAFAASLARHLEANLPNVPIEVVNAALPGYGSRRVLLIVREITRFEPDLLVIYSGHNEWAEQSFHRRILEMDPRLFRLREALLTTRLANLVGGLRPTDPAESKRAADELLEEQSQMFGVLARRSDGSGYATPEQIAQRDALYRANVEEMVRVAQQAGAAVLLMTLTQNFADWEPGASGHREGLSKPELQRWYAGMEKGHAAVARGDCPAALEAFGEALAIDAEFAELHYRVATCYRTLGDIELARTYYRRASDLDLVPHGAPTHYDDALRALAARSGALLLDSDAALTAASRDGLVGAEFFNEFVHPNLRAHQILGRALATVLREAGVPRPGSAWLGNDPTEMSPSELYAADPQLEIREHLSWRAVCQVSRRDRCVDEQTRALAALGVDSARDRNRSRE